MARIRSIKPEVRTSEKVNSWPIDVRYFWIMLWGYLDDHGKGKDNAKLIVADAYPLDDNITHKDVETWLTVLEDAEVITRYEANGTRYIAAKNWGEHQKIAHPAKSVIPDPPQSSEAPPTPPGTVAEDYGNLPQSSEDAPNAAERLPQTSENTPLKQRTENREQRTEEQGRPTPIPPTFTLTPERTHWAQTNTPAVNPTLATGDFIDYWRDNQKPKSNWETTWRNWMRRRQADAEAKGWKPPTTVKDLTDPMNW